MTMDDLSKSSEFPYQEESLIQQIQRDKTYVAPRYNEFDMRKLQERMQEDNIVKKLIKGNGKKEDFPQFRQGYKDR